MSVFGKIRFVIKGDNISRLLKLIFDENITCAGLSENSGTLTGQCSLKDSYPLERACIDLDLEYEFQEDKSLVSAVRWLWGRKGILVGALVGTLLVTFLSNTVLKINVIGGDEKLAEDIVDFLETKGVTYGSFMPQLDFFDLEISMKQELDQVAWVGMYDTGGTLNVDVVPATETPNVSQHRLPSDLVAARDGQIVRAEVYGGQLAVPVGSGVHKGQLLVSGEVKLSEDKTVFRRSVGKIYAEYTDKAVFECPFVSERKIVDEQEAFKQKYLSFFSLDIPLFTSSPSDELYQTDEHISKLSFLGMKLPVGIKTVNCTPYEFRPVRYTRKQATAEVYKLKSNYETNLLSDCEIKDSEEHLTVDETGVKLTVSYTVVSDIALEKEILLK